jgi:phosphoribosylformylglycinamidine synthase II
MPDRIEVASGIADARAQVRTRYLQGLGVAGRIDRVEIVDVYTSDADLDEIQLRTLAEELANPVTQRIAVNEALRPEDFNWAVEVGFLPGVTDNVGHTARQMLADLLKITLPPDRGVYSSQVTFLSGRLSREEAESIAAALANPLIHRVRVKSRRQFEADGGMGTVAPRVHLGGAPATDTVRLLEATDEELVRIGKLGIVGPDGTRRGPLALDLTFMKAIQAYFRRQGRDPTDVELESLAQTWSEHCKHTIFADPLDEISEGLFRTYIRGATETVRQNKGADDICVSVFKDNSGAIVFDQDHLVTHKVETHNSPSALDPFGGAITGIVGVNRDTIGFGLGAKPVVNVYGYCFADPNDARALYKGPDFTQKMLSPRMILEGVVHGVNVGGNSSGIPTPQGFLFFHPSYRGKPLVFVGTIGLIPRTSAGRPAHQKKARPGDLIVMAGGRVGKDGIHGATFSSEIMDAGSPAAAVQIGDPITQKKLSDAIVKEARDRELYTSITDNGAGGLSCSVAEMARECGGCQVQLDRVPLKYPGLAPWEIWCSESQERMTLAVPPEKWEALHDLLERRGVEATVIGRFTDSGRCLVEHHGRTVMEVEMAFLHQGLPPKIRHTTDARTAGPEPEIPPRADLTGTFLSMLGRLNIASTAFISRQYDHEVQGGSVIKPLQGRGQVGGDATVIRPLLTSPKGIAISQGLHPTYGQIDTYHMAAGAIDTAIRGAVCVGADPDRLALLDNFCWCSSDEPERLGQLKRAARACYDYAAAYGAPFVSGKDSMFNDFKGYDENGRAITISVLPTLLISSMGVMEDASKAVTLDAKVPGDLVYVLGETLAELGGSEYYALWGEQRGQTVIGSSVPRVDAEKNLNLYRAYFRCVQEGLIASAQSVGRGGLAVALAKTAMGGMLGLEVDLGKLQGGTAGCEADAPGEDSAAADMSSRATPAGVSRDDLALFSESQGRMVVTVAPRHRAAFEDRMRGLPHASIGQMSAKEGISIRGLSGETIVETTVGSSLQAYRGTFQDY